MISRAAIAVATGLLLCGCGTELIDPAPPVGQGKPGGLACDERLHAAELHVTAEVRDEAEGCQSHGDCTLVTPVTSCFRLCPQAVVVDEAEDVEEAVAEAEERWCRGFAVECAGHVEVPESCPPARAVCIEGRCRQVAR